MMGLLEGYYVPLYKFHYSPVGHDEKVCVCERGGRGGERGRGVEGEREGERERERVRECLSFLRWTM